MKKILIALTLIVVFAVCLTACEIDLGNSEFSKFNKMIATKRDSVEIQVKTTANGETLTNVFIVDNLDDNKSVITYKVESLNNLSLDGTNDSEYKSVNEGTVLVENGKITQLNGEPQAINFSEIKSPQFKFSASYFNYVSIEEGKIELSVKNPQAFTGLNDFDGRDMTFVGTFSEKLFNDIVLSYTDKDGNKVEIKYTYLPKEIRDVPQGF